MSGADHRGLGDVSQPGFAEQRGGHELDPESGSKLGHELDAKLDHEMRRLGHALLESTDAVIASVTERALRRAKSKREPMLDDAIDDSFVRLGTLSTAAVARWIAGESVDGAFAAGEEFSRAVAQMVASSDVPLAEVVRRCQYWRDACVEALQDALGANPARAQALSSALRSIHLAADHALANMSAIFDGERWRIQQELTRRQEELAFLATHDGLTKLANRSLVVARLEQMLEGECREENGVAVLFIDLDGFKGINDTLGHSAGDQLLAATAARLRAAVRDSDTLGRLGGDEFVVLAGCVSDAETLEELADRLCRAFAEPFSLGLACGPLRIGASIGVALAQPGCSAAQLLHDADLAMYTAKSRHPSGSGRSAEVPALPAMPANVGELASASGVANAEHPANASSLASASALANLGVLASIDKPTVSGAAAANESAMQGLERGKLSRRASRLRRRRLRMGRVAGP